MAIQILNDPGLWAGFGSNLGQGFGSGLSSSLNYLAQNKMQQMAQKQQQAQLGQALQALGLPAELASLPESVQSTFIKQKLQEPQNQAYAQALQGILGGGETSGLGLGGLSAPSGIPGLQAGSQLSGGLMAPQQSSGGFNMPQLGGLNQQQATKLAELGLGERRTARKEAFAERQLAAKEKQSAFKETKKERSDIITGAKSAKDDNTRLDRMEELNKKGKLDSPHYINLLKKAGFDYPALLKPDSQEFQKLSIDFLKNAKDAFGSRISNFEADTFLKSIPSLTQSKEGRERVIRNLKLMNEGKLARAQALKEVVRASSGIPPLDLAEQVEEHAAPKLEDLAEKFRRGEESEKPESLELGSKFTKLPAPSSLPVGAEITNKKTGKKYVNRGDRWAGV